MSYKKEEITWLFITAKKIIYVLLSILFSLGENKIQYKLCIFVIYI